MKIEKISENQIRCTLTREELEENHIDLTELAYGTEKAKELFRKLMVKAADEFGFDAENCPLMVEAIPFSKEKLVLLITKVDDPDELDSRFSRFTKPIAEEEDYDEDDDVAELPDFEEYIDENDSADVQNVEVSEEVLAQRRNEFLSEIFKTMKEIEKSGRLGEYTGENTGDSTDSSADNEKASKVNIPDRIYMFKALDDVIVSARLVKNIYKSNNTLYKNPQDSKFYLYMTSSDNTESDFNKSCNTVSEYGNRVNSTYSTKSHMDEHYKVIIECNALQQLGSL